MGLFNFFKKANNDVKVVEANETQGFRICADIPVNRDCVFVVNGIAFVGCYIGNVFNQMQFVLPQGLLNIENTAQVDVVREANASESARLHDTKYHVAESHVVRFLRLTDVAA